MAASCGGSSGSGGYSPSPTPTPTPTPTPAGTISVVGQQGNRSFNPNPSPMPADRMLTWSNSDNVTHRMVANDGSWDTGNLGPGAASAAIQMPTGGSNYHCSIHPTMVGVVNDTSGTTPPCTGQYC
jgi:plastocyanin